MSKKNFWWNDDPEIGSYKFCYIYNESENYDFYISEVAVSFKYGWTEEERQRRFKGAKFIFGGCADGWSFSDHLLKAETIEEAKREFEAWYEQYLSNRVENLKGALSEAIEDHKQFVLYSFNKCSQPLNKVDTTPPYPLSSL